VEDNRAVINTLLDCLNDHDDKVKAYSVKGWYNLVLICMHIKRLNFDKSSCKVKMQGAPYKRGYALVLEP
jgi:hypothetical protein